MIFSKMGWGSKFAVECDKISKISQKILKFWAALLKKMGFSKNMKFLKMGRASKFAVECSWNSKISQNIQYFGWYTKIESVLKKNWFFFNWLKVAILL